MNLLLGAAAWRFGRRLGAGRWADSVLGAGVLFYGLAIAINAVAGFAGLPCAGIYSNLAGPLIVFAVSMLVRGVPRVEAPKVGFLPLPVGLFLIFAALAVAGVVVWDTATPPPAGGDPFIYHLTFPAFWLKAGRIGYVALPYGAQAATYYPLNMELFYLWVMRPLHSDLLLNIAQVPCWLLAALAVAALARETGIGRPGAAIGAAVGLLVPGLIQQATVARVDVAFAAWFLLSIYFAMRWGRTREPGVLILFGIAAGLLIGTKSIGLIYSFVPVLLFVFYLRGRGRHAAADVVKVVCLAAAFGGFWYVRNWIETGNPLFPLDVNLFGLHIFPGAYGKEAMREFHTSDPAELLRIGNLFLGFWLEEFLLISMLVSAALTIVLGKHGKNGKSGKRKAAGRQFLFLAPWIVIGLFWFVNPHNNLTNGRFLFPAILLFCYYVAVVVDEYQDWVAKVWAWLALAAVAASSFGSGQDHLPRLLSDLAGLAFGRGNVLLKPASGAIALVAASLGIAVLFIAFKKRSLLRFSIGLALAVCLVFGLNGIWNYKNDREYDWYRGFPVGRAWAELEEMSKGRSLRIAAVGNERMYGLFGAGLRHDVFAVNVDSRPGWQFHDYWRFERGAGGKPAGIERPQYHRLRGNPYDWIENLRRLRIDVVFATTLDPISMKYMNHDELGFPVEAGWAETRPETFRLLFANSEVRIFAVRPLKRGGVGKKI